MFKNIKKLFVVGLSILTIGGYITPFVFNNSFVYAENISNEKIREQKLLELSQYIDKYVVKKDDKLELTNELNILNFIKKHKSDYVDGKQFKTEQEVLNYFKNMIFDFNKKAANPYKKINEKKELVDKYSSRLAFDYSNYSRSIQWTGVKHIFYTDRTARNFAYDLKDSSSSWNIIAILGIKALPLSAISASIGWWAGNVGDNLIKVIDEDSGQGCILFVTWVGYYTITKR